MFDKLVVSTSQKRKGRTAKFFLGTVVVYLAVAVSAFALSIVLASPQLADSNQKHNLIGPVLEFTTRAPSVVADYRNSGGAPRQDLRNLQSLDHIIEHPQTGVPRTILPLGERISGGGVPGGDPNPLGNSFGVIGGDPRASEAPPRPPDQPRQPARTAPEDIRPVRITSNVLQGKAIERRTPLYPPLAKQIHLQGEVSVEVIISPDGRVESARVVSGHPMLAQYAREAALGWRFEATLLNNLPVRVTGVITFVFKMNE